MAGASLAAELAGEASVLLLEAESQPGYHSTGRSAAFWSETYGGPLIQPLTSASGPFLAAPPADFAEAPFLSPRGALHVAEAGGEAALDALAAEFAGSDIVARAAGPRRRWRRALPGPQARLDAGARRAELRRHRRRRPARGLSQARARARRRAGHRRAAAGRDAEARPAGRSRRGAVGSRPISSSTPPAPGRTRWRGGPAPGRSASSPIAAPSSRRGSSRRRRADLPLVIDAQGRFYFKPEAGGRLWLSPHDETACDPCDCAPEEIDVALAIDGLEQIVDWRVARSSGAGRASGASRRTGCRSTASPSPASSGARGRAASASRPRRPRRSWRRLAARCGRTCRDIDPAPYRAGALRD